MTQKRSSSKALSLAVTLVLNAGCSSSPEAYTPHTARIHTTHYQGSSLQKERAQEQANYIPQTITQERPIVK